MTHLKRNEIKKPWHVIVTKQGTPLCDVIGDYRWGWIASIVSFFISVRIWLEDEFGIGMSTRRCAVYEVSESFEKEPLELANELHKEINTLLEKEGFKEPA